MRSPVVWIVVAIIVALMAIGVLAAVVTIVGGLVYAPVTAVTAGIDREPSPRPVTSVVVGPAQQDAERVDYATLIGREKATTGIVVTGEGIVKARPDRATVTVGAQTRAWRRCSPPRRFFSSSTLVRSTSTVRSLTMWTSRYQTR